MVIKYTKSVLNHVLPHNLTACKLKPPMYLFTVESFFFFFQFRFSAESYPACFSFGVGEEGSLHQLCAWDSMYYGGNLVQINSNNLGPSGKALKLNLPFRIPFLYPFVYHPQCHCQGYWTMGAGHGSQSMHVCINCLVVLEVPPS